MAFSFPTSQELAAVERELLPRLQANRPIFDILPITTHEDTVLRWEQEDNYVGLQQVRGIEGKPRRVNRVGEKTYVMLPGVYGEYVPLSETEMMLRRQIGSLDAPISLDDLVMKAVEQLQLRFLDRVEYIGWNALLGTFSVSNETGVVHTDTFTVQTASAAVGWATVATAKPIYDMRQVKLKARGKGCSFGRRAKAYANAGTINNMLNNTNASDLFGKRVNQSTLSSLAELNKILLDADLPEIVEYDAGYLNDSGTWTNYIPDDKVIVVGARDNNRSLGDYCMTRNVNTPNMAAGQYSKVIVKDDEVPLSVEVHNGHNGGPRIVFPSAVVVLST